MTVDPRRLADSELSGLTSLAVEVQQWHDANLASEQECVRCHSTVHTPSELEPTPLCNLCAQAIAARLGDLLAHAACVACEPVTADERPAFGDATVEVTVQAVAIEEERVRTVVRDAVLAQSGGGDNADWPYVAHVIAIRAARRLAVPALLTAIRLTAEERSSFVEHANALLAEYESWRASIEQRTGLVFGVDVYTDTPYRISALRKILAGVLATGAGK